MAMIEMRDVSKWYGPVQVLKGCSTAVSKGEVVVVCGPSGSGKSTLIKTVNGLEPSRSATRRPTSPGSARRSAWSSSTSSSSRT